MKAFIEDKRSVLSPSNLFATFLPVTTQSGLSNEITQSHLNLIEFLSFGKILLVNGRVINRKLTH